MNTENNQMSTNKTSATEAIANLAKACLSGQAIGKSLANNEQFTELETWELGALIEEMIEKFNLIESQLGELDKSVSS